MTIKTLSFFRFEYLVKKIKRSFVSKAIATKLYDLYKKCPSEGLRTGVQASANRSHH